EIDKKIGFYTNSVDITSTSVLSNAVLKNINKASEKLPKGNVGKLFETFSAIHSESLRRLEENKGYLVRETVNESKVDGYLKNVLLFFNLKLKKEIEKMNPQPKLERLKAMRPTSSMWRTIKQVKYDAIIRECPHYGTLKNKFVDFPPDMGDIALLAQAIYFHELFSKAKLKFYLASTDHHFVEIEKNDTVNDFVPSKIKEEFGFECLRPSKVLDQLKH
ncbi:hypothetical protein JW707_04915, partial [Candidatus Woesearchaeota archaeon]|nr:hypothetical protein [Candidatus Woesearchaeota archaeon]